MRHDQLLESTNSSDGIDYDSLLECLDGTAIWVVRDPGQFEYISAGAEEVWGVSAEELSGDIARLLEATHPDDRSRILEEVSKPADEIKEERYEIRAVQPDGTVRWVLTHQIPVREDDGSLRHIVGICTDITEQKQREQEYEALNRLLRHDISKDMNVIMGWGEVLEDHVDETGEDILETILSTANNMISLTETAGDYAKSVSEGDDMDIYPVALRPVLKDEISLREEMFPHVEFHSPDPIPDLEVQANGMLSSVFRNLLTNAVNHNDKDDPVVEIEVDSLSDHVIVRVADNGPGISPDVQDSLFDKGVKGPGSSGTGIGLNLVRTLVRQYGGEVQVTENEPTGTIFHIRLQKTNR